MPFLNRPRIRGWLDEHNWSYRRLADACLEIDPADKMSSEVIRNAVMGHNQFRPGRIRLIEKVTKKYGDPIPYAELVSEEKKGDKGDDGPKEEPTSPPPRREKSTGPKRLPDQGAAA